jgi:hypothetical protein
MNFSTVDTPSDLPSLRVLKGIVGTPARLSFQNPLEPESVVRIPGTLREVTATGVLIDLLFVLPAHNVHQPVLLEVMTGDSLYQCCTFIVYAPSPLLVHLHFPSDLHTTDRRRDPRYRVNIETQVQTEKREYPVRIQNLSLGGCGIIVGQRFALHTHLSINLESLGLRPALVEAEVVRASLTPLGIWEIGLRFLHLSVLQREQLTTYFDQQEHH